MATDYEQLADRYDEDRARYVVPPDDIIETLTASAINARVLDVGCGTGTWLMAQASVSSDSSVTLIGADPSAAMLAVANAKGVANLIRTGAEELPFSDGSLDYVVANFTFHHWDKERALCEIDRVLSRSNGVFRMNNIEPETASASWLYEYFPETVELDAARFWSPDRICNALTARGFNIERRIEFGVAPVLAVDALADAERRVSSQLASLGDAAYQRGLARLREAAQTSTTLTSAWATFHATATRP